MKISLITIKSPYNYGAVLQCFATFKYLKKLNFDVQVIDYCPKNLGEGSGFLKETIMKLLTFGRRSKITKFNKENLIYTNICYRNYRELKKKPPISDIYIVGSDQVWNSQLSKGKLDPVFFIDFLKNENKISYASSMGRSDVDISELKIMKEYLKNFSHISVREESAKKLLESVGLKNIAITLDPIFLLEKQDYIKFIKPIEYKKYLLIYSFEKNPIIEKLAQEISKKMGLQIIEIGTFRSKYSNDEYLQNIGVEDFLSLIKYANFVITSSFHGTAFSILFNKEFVSVEPSIRKNRLENIVKIFGIEKRLINKKSNYTLDNLLDPIDYRKVNKLIDIYSEKSRIFLKNAIGFSNFSKERQDSLMNSFGGKSIDNFFQSTDKTLCCGCRACEQICPENAIHMEQDKEGFSYPVIDKKRCINCGLCVKACPINNKIYESNDTLEEPKLYAAYHKDEKILKDSTSGGAFTALAQAFCDKNYAIFGASFDKDMIVKHTFVTDIKDIFKFRGSKYVQSDIGSSFKDVKNFLKEGKKILFSGTPCQVAGLKEFLGEDHKNLLSIDFICHGVSSPGIFEKYKQYLMQKYKKNIFNLNFRDKGKGWAKPYTIVKFEDNKTLKNVYADNPFVVGFYKSYFIRPICHYCPFVKMPRVSDITLGDFWGIQKIDPAFYNKNGNSFVLINTQKGRDVFDNSKKYLSAVEENFEKAKKFNPNLYHPSDINPRRSQFMEDVQKISFENLRKKYLRPRSLLRKGISLVLNQSIRGKIKEFLNLS